MTRRKLFVLAAPVLMAAGAWVSTSHMAVFAYPTPQCSISEISGNATTNAGATNTFTFKVLDLHGNAFANQTIFFTEGGVAGSVNPTQSTTGSNGQVSTVFTAGNTNGQATVTATDPSESCAGSASTLVQGGGGTAGLPNTGNGNGVGLPNTSTGAPGPNGALYLGLGLALMVILGGAVTLRRSRTTAS